VHPDRLLDQLTSIQLSEWEAYDTLDPIGTWRTDYNFASFQSLFINIIRSLYPKDGVEPEMTTAVDLMPVWDRAARKAVEEKRPKQSVDDMKSVLMSLADSANKREERKEAIKNHPPPKR